MQDQEQALRFPLTSEQCELLLEFETVKSLQDLAGRIRRDVSVVSRQLSALAQAAPVIEKQDGRWRITAFGRQINNLTRATVSAQKKILDQQGSLRFSSVRMPSLAQEAALFVVGVQRGFDDPVWGARNNPGAEERIAQILAAWRRVGRPVIFCRHVSTEPQSPLRAGSQGTDFKPEGKPLPGELVIDKNVNSAFVGTRLEAEMRQRGIKAAVVVGFSTNHCVDATIRTGADLGFTMYAVTDAVVAFDRVSWDGRLVKAEDLQLAALTALNQEFATVIDSEALLQSLGGDGVEA